MPFISPEAQIEILRLEHTHKVADFGAGSGAYALAAAKAVASSGTCYAIDLNRELLNRVKNDATFAHIHNLEIIWGDLERKNGSTLPSSSIDTVLVCNLLFLLEDTGAVFKEAYRILKNGGKLLVVEWSASHSGVGPHDKQVVTEKHARKYVEDAGFVIDHDVPSGDYHYGFTARKA